MQVWDLCHCLHSVSRDFSTIYSNILLIMPSSLSLVLGDNGFSNCKHKQIHFFVYIYIYIYIYRDFESFLNASVFYSMDSLHNYKGLDCIHTQYASVSMHWNGSCVLTLMRRYSDYEIRRHMFLLTFTFRLQSYCNVHSTLTLLEIDYSCMRDGHKWRIIS